MEIYSITIFDDEENASPIKVRSSISLNHDDTYPVTLIVGSDNSPKAVYLHLKSVDLLKKLIAFRNSVIANIDPIIDRMKRDLRGG